jgi:DNA-binding response OmpR family regulator
MSVCYRRISRLHDIRPAPPACVEADRQEPVEASDLVIDKDRRVVLLAGRPLRLTFMEFQLLAYLAASPLRVHSRRQLITTVWGQPAVGDVRTVDVHVARLRRKLGPAYRDLIATVRSVGYTFDPSAAS